MKYYKGHALISDFDGTITKQDVGDFLLLHFKLVSKKDIDLGYSKNIPVEKWMKRYFILASKLKKKNLEKALLKIKLRPKFKETALFCLKNKIPLEITSGGVDLYSKPIFKANKLKIKNFFGKFIKTGKSAKIEYPYLKGKTLSQFKKRRVLYYKKKGFKVIFCGDAPNDLAAAKAADEVFASRFLPKLLEKEKKPYKRLTSFSKVLKLLKKGV